MDWFEVAKMGAFGYLAISAVTYTAYLIFQTLRR